MFRRSKKTLNWDRELLENMKNEMEIQLGKRGVKVSGIKMEMNIQSISLRIPLQCIPPQTLQHICTRECL